MVKSSVVAAEPVAPVAPVGPVAPVEPVDPVAPVGPVGPVAPGLPVMLKFQMAYVPEPPMVSTLIVIDDDEMEVIKPSMKLDGVTV